MRKRVLYVFLTMFLLFATGALAEKNLYQQDSLLLTLNVNGGIELIATSDQATLKEATARLFLYPAESQRQKIITLDSEGVMTQEGMLFRWEDGSLGDKTYDYLASIRTTDDLTRVKQKIPFPIPKEDLKGLEQYLQSSETIDSQDTVIIKTATELVEGEDDLFKTAFILAEWVERNVQYDLNTLTEKASQKASWVLENKQGVCDEMTSLFIAMARAVGIPARFVSGISYTTSDLFEENWQPHGWAEVYFPGTGWVSFDITFGEYGYIDATHIKLRDGFDPAEPATKFTWLAEDVTLETKGINLTVSVLDEGNFVPERLQLKQEILSQEIGFGSYNLIKGIVKNTADHYAATTLQLAVPKEVEIVGRNKRTILLPPGETKETYWIVKLTDTLKKNFVYGFPSVIYSEKNISVEGSFSARQDYGVYSKTEIEKLIVQEDEKEYSSLIKLECDYPAELALEQTAVVTCSIKNVGNKNLEGLTICLGHVCESKNLPINQIATSQITIEGKTAGWQKIIVGVENAEVEKRTSLEYLVVDKPSINISVKYPEELTYGSDLALEVLLTKESFEQPENVIVTLRGPAFENQWSITQLVKDETLEFRATDFPLLTKNSFIIDARWEDRAGEEFSTQETFIIQGKANSFSERIKMFFNRIRVLL